MGIGQAGGLQDQPVRLKFFFNLTDGRQQFAGQGAAGTSGKQVFNLISVSPQQLVINAFLPYFIFQYHNLIFFII